VSNSHRSFNSKLAASSQAWPVREGCDRSHDTVSVRAHQAVSARKRMNHTTARVIHFCALHFPLGDFVVRSEGNLRRRIDTRRAATRQLRRPQARQDRELQRTDVVRASDRDSRSPARRE